MQTHFLFDALSGYAPFEQIVRESGKEQAVIAASGLAGAQKAHLACALSERTGRPLLFLCESERAAAQTMEDLSALLGGGVSLFPAREITFYQDVAASREVAYRRIETLRRLVAGKTRAVVAPADALLHRVMPRAVFYANTISLRVGEQVPTDELLCRLLAAGASTWSRAKASFPCAAALWISTRRMRPARCAWSFLTMRSTPSASLT